MDNAAAASIAVDVLEHLGLTVPPELIGARPRELWPWAAENWNAESLTGATRLPPQ